MLGEFERVLKEMAMSSNLSGGNEKIMVNLTHESRYLGRDSNGARPKYNYRGLPLYSLHDVFCYL
jgi:hypothetical protein